MNATDTENYDTRVMSDLSTLPKDLWNTLVLETCGHLHPALRAEFWQALHDSGCASPATGWEPYFFTLWQDHRLQAAVPLYRKHHSYGEYVFDWSWADTYRRQGYRYYPKWLTAIPFTPVGAPKLLARSSAARTALAQHLMRFVQASDASGWHGLFLNDAEVKLFQTMGCGLRRTVQFHWQNPGYAHFENFLQALTAAKRRKIRAERRKVAHQGVTVEALTGADIRIEHWDFFTRCYERTYQAHHSTPYLNRDFFARLGHAMSAQTVLFIAKQGGQALAASLCFYNATALYGRYWGALAFLDSLHFEVCYYAPIEFCITHGITYFEGGAQGEHKQARGFEPHAMWSAHWLAHPGFAAAVEQFLSYEAVGIEGYVDELREHSAFRARPAH